MQRLQPDAGALPGLGPRLKVPEVPDGRRLFLERQDDLLFALS
jgi:hypothetical protein